MANLLAERQRQADNEREKENKNEQQKKKKKRRQKKLNLIIEEEGITKAIGFLKLNLCELNCIIQGVSSLTASTHHIKSFGNLTR